MANMINQSIKLTFLVQNIEMMYATIRYEVYFYTYHKFDLRRYRVTDWKWYIPIQSFAVLFSLHLKVYYKSMAADSMAFIHIVTFCSEITCDWRGSHWQQTSDGWKICINTCGKYGSCLTSYADGFVMQILSVGQHASQFSWGTGVLMHTNPILMESQLLLNGDWLLKEQVHINWKEEMVHIIPTYTAIGDVINSIYRPTFVHLIIF